jgi:hypothetical protein
MKLYNISYQNRANFIQKINDMKKLRTIVIILFLSLIFIGMTSCEISRHVENGSHRGWFFNHNNHRQHKGAVLIITPENRNNRDRHSDHD